MFRLRAQHCAWMIKCEWITQSPSTRNQIARRVLAGVEVLVELLIGGRENEAMLPVQSAEFLVTLDPEKRIAVAGHAQSLDLSSCRHIDDDRCPRTGLRPEKWSSLKYG
jgi:hypothetical protein